MTTDPVYYLEMRRRNLERVKKVTDRFDEPVTDDDAIRLLAEAYRTKGTATVTTLFPSKAQRYHMANRVYRKTQGLKQVSLGEILALAKGHDKRLLAGLSCLADDEIDQTGLMLLVFNHSIENEEAFKYTNETVYGPGLPEDFLEDNIEEFKARHNVNVKPYHTTFKNASKTSAI
ncbi:hypothetical protein GOV11_03020 [Candidatus Woesearchaeota archaeon]|nr:hypothetical protein [Candidatus Woesearchaeota archaeon]